MADSELTGELDSRFSSPGATAPPWSEVDSVLTEAKLFWLSTVRRDGRPHVTPLPAVWLDGRLHLCTGPEEQKAKNLASNPNCVLTTGTAEQDSGLDVIVEGAAERVQDRSVLESLAALWKSRLGWDYAVEDGGFSGQADTKALVFAVQPAKVLVFGKGEPYSQTRFRP